MNNSFKKESPLLSLPSLGGGSHSTLVRKPSGGGGGGAVNHSFRAPVSIGIPFDPGPSNYITYLEYQSNGTVLLQQNLWGEWKYDLSTPYNISPSSISLKSGSARYWTISEYSSKPLHAYRRYSGSMMRFFYDNDKAFYYGADGDTREVQDLDVYTQTTVTEVSSSSNPFSSVPNYTSNIVQYVKKSGGGVAYIQLNRNDKKIYLRNYASATTTTVSSYSVLDYSTISDVGNGTNNIFLSTNGTTLSIMTNRASNSSTYDVHKWTLSTAFDLSTAGSVTTTNKGGWTSVYQITIQNGYSVNDASFSGKYVGINEYGGLYGFSYTTDGDLTTVTRNSSMDRDDNGAYLRNSSYVEWHDDGKDCIMSGYDGTGYLYDSTSNPYGWKHKDIVFGNRSSGHTYIGFPRSDNGMNYSDGVFNANKSKMYSSFYGSNASDYKVKQFNINTAGDLTTLVAGYNQENSSTTFTGWTSGYNQLSHWYDKVNKKLHLLNYASGSGQYYVFNCNSSEELDGTYTTTPTGYNPGNLVNLYSLQPLSHNGKYFVYHTIASSTLGDCKIILLDHAFEPARGYTEVHSFTPVWNLPNGSTRNFADENINSWYLRMYVASGRIHFTWADDTALTLVVDITIGGQAPDDIT